jgi:hypothetical protein
MKAIRAKIYFFEGVLATRPNDDEIFQNFIASNAPDAATRQEEIEETSVDDVFEKGTTVFPRTKKGEPMFWDYQWKGYMKEKCSFIRKNDEELSLDDLMDLMDIPKELLWHAPETKKKTTKKVETEEVAEEAPKKRGRKKKTDDDASPSCASIKAFRKEIDGNLFVFPRKIVINTNDPITLNQRPLRASSPQGERVALSSSEEIHGGATCDIKVAVMIDDWEDSVRRILDYGIVHGTGQWRNSGAGRFLWQELDADGNQIGGNYTPEAFTELLERANM